MNKEQIILEIQRTASENGGVPLGLRAFKSETGIAQHSWVGKYWRNWSDALKDAGFKPNHPNVAPEKSFLILSLARLTRKNGCFPTYADMLLEKQTDKTFPNRHAFTRLGTVNERIELVRHYVKEHPEYSDVLEVLPNNGIDNDKVLIGNDHATKIGYVYLVKHGSRREYKIGKTFNPLRREGEIALQLPEKLEPIHYIKTDDPSGIENYWHTRFAEKRKEGEWFVLTPLDIQAFKKWKRIY
jgi:hypothetical protein